MTDDICVNVSHIIKQLLTYKSNTLFFNDKFNHPISQGDIPLNITLIHFGYVFNQPLTIGAIPPNVVTLYFGGSFNQSIETGIIPLGVVDLKFGMGI